MTPSPIAEIMAGPHISGIAIDDGRIVITEPLRFVPVYDFAPTTIVGRPVDDWRAYIASMGLRSHEDAA